MQIEIYRMQAENNLLTITLEAICDSFSSLLWDIRYYECGQFEIYIAANEKNISLFQEGKIIARNDDRENFGIIENIKLDADAENGDYLTISGHFLMSLLKRRIIYPTLYITSATAYGEILQQAVYKNCIYPYPTIREDPINVRRIFPGLQNGTITGACWEQTATLQISYQNLMEWIYSICQLTGGTASIVPVKTEELDQYELHFMLSEGTDRSILQAENPHVIFSDEYNNLLSFSSYYNSETVNSYAVFGAGEGNNRHGVKRYVGERSTGFGLYEVYVDARDISDQTENGEISPAEYNAMLEARGREHLKEPVTELEFEIAADRLQFQYQKDYFVGDYVTVRHRKYGMIHPKIQLAGMIESFDSNGRKLTPTFALREE